MTCAVAVLACFLVVFASSPARGESPLRLGVFSYRPEPLTLAQWRPLTACLESALQRPVSLAAYDDAELATVAARGEVNVVITTPNHFILLTRTVGLSAPLATVITRRGEHELNAHGGAIFTRTDRGDITSLAHLAGKRIAAPSLSALCGLQVQTLRTEVKKAPLDLGALVADVIRELRPETADREVRWRVSELPTVAGDRTLLHTVLANLIANAIKFTGPRETAEIEVGWEPGEHGETVVFVRDNGVGFDPAYADKLFGVFQRLHRADEFEGTGIGLASARRIIARHGGRTWAEGNVDHGAAFYFSLP